MVNRNAAHAGPPVERDAALLLERFNSRSTALVTRIRKERRPRREVALRLFFLHALVVSGSLPGGSVSWRSHWSGFASTCRSEEIVRRITGTYRTQRAYIQRHMLEVKELHERTWWSKDRPLAGWRELLLEFRAEVAGMLAEGRVVTSQPLDRAAARRFREVMTKRRIRHSEFLDVFCSDERFLVGIQHSTAMLVSRALVNLFYVLLARIGLAPIDKFLLCYFAFRSVEEWFHCDLLDVLRVTMEEVATGAGGEAVGSGRHEGAELDTRGRHGASSEERLP